MHRPRCLFVDLGDVGSAKYIINADIVEIRQTNQRFGGRCSFAIFEFGKESLLDSYGRTYAEIVVRAKNSYGAYVPTRYAVGFFDVSESAPCAMIPKSLFVLPGIMVGAQRKVAKKMIKFGTPRE